MAKFVERDQSQLYLLPVDMREWLPEDDLAHFVVEAVERVPMGAFRVNERGTCSAQYHPRMMLALLICCYADGIFGSRRIERATYRDIGVRYVASNSHPDHDTICAFRRNNFEAVVDAEGSQLVLGARVSNNASDRRELVADVEAIPPGVGAPARVLADSGYANGQEVKRLERRGTEVLAATETEGCRRHDFRPPVEPRPCPTVRAEWIAAMRAKMAQPGERALYRLRRQTVEPVFGIVKQSMGFRQFLLRGLNKVQGEWVLVMLANNCKRLHNLTLA